MKELTLTQRLDAVLKFINTEEDPQQLIKFYQSTPKNQLELAEILEKLEKDGFIKRVFTSNTNTFKNTPTVEGRFFIGYEKRRILDEDMISKISRKEIADDRYRDRLLYATWCAGIAAVLLLLWQVWIWFYPIHSNYPFWIWETIPKTTKKN